MKRRLEQDLKKWKDNPMRKPLLLLGARQVGKTWLMRHFGDENYKDVVYIRFDRNERMRRIFETSNYDMKELLLLMQAETNINIKPGDTLIILDEIQDCPAALTSLKYFCEDLPDYHVMAAGSLLGVKQHHGTGFPVGKVNTMILYPLTFREFMTALEHPHDIDFIELQKWESVKLISDRLTHLLKLYYYIGGMPEVVNTYLQTKDFSAVRSAQNEILSNYANDFSQHVPAMLAAKLSLLWESIPHQLAKENKRFIYKEVDSKMRARDLESAMDWLFRAGLIYRVDRINEPSLPIGAYQDGAFKLYFLDVGLLGAKCELEVSTILEKSAIFKEFKGALTEQFVQQELRAESQISPHYWQSDTFRAEVDFVIQTSMNVVPIEVKAERNTKAKSLLNYCRKYKPVLAVRISMNDFSENNLETSETTNTTLLDIPLYATFMLLPICREALLK
ncbi:MAG: ATP-binding protein [Akkermansia sp.]|nr:ATP-binding protein [Akkermansia sp.]